LKPPEFKGQLRLDWTNEDKKHSASALEIYANCPFVYLTDEVLRLRRWEHAEAGMDGMIRGLIWHEVLAGFLGQYRGKRLDPADLAKFLKELTSLFDVAIARLVSSGKIVLDAWWEMEETIWQEGLKRWLELEIERQRHDHSVPAYFEWSFGRVPASSSDPRSVMETLVLSFEKQKAQLQGKIDRVDLLSDGSFRVIDYKTGRIPSSGLLKKGILLQVPIYMLAVDRLLGTPNTPESEGEYLSLTYSGRRMKIPGRNNREEIVKGVTISVLSYADRIRKGDFSPDPAGDCPSYCLNRDCCHFVKQEQASMEEDFDE
jgi:ATP-dependent helicase/nuclease subunit B